MRFILISSLKAGVINIYDLNKPGKEKYINYVNEIGLYSNQNNNK